MQRAKLIFTSEGLNTKLGAKLIAEELKGDGISAQSTILVVLEENYIEAIALAVREACVNMGFRSENIFCSGTLALPDAVDYIYVTEGNTFEILKHLQKRSTEAYSTPLLPYIRRNVAMGSTYIGASAGAMLAGVDVKLALDFDKNNYGITDFTGLGLVRGTIIAHFTKRELARFLANSTKEELSPYETVYQVENGGVLRLCYQC